MEQILWAIANELKGNMNADEFRDYILGFIFYKYLSDKVQLKANVILQDENLLYQNITDKAYIEAIEKEFKEDIGFFIKPEELFENIAHKGKEGKNILDNLEEVLNNIEKSALGSESEDDFNHLFDDIDLTSTKLGKTPEERSKLVSKILIHLSGIDFDLKNTESDVLGDAYEYLIAQFASGAGKKAGEFYTPQAVSKCLAKIVISQTDGINTIYDPTCGSGSLLLRVARELKNKNSIISFYGQELNRTTYNLARMNMLLHDVR